MNRFLFSQWNSIRKNRAGKLYCVASCVFVYLMMAPTNLGGMLAYGAIALLTSSAILLSFGKEYEGGTERALACAVSYVVCVIICFFIVRSFSARWSVSGMVQRTADTFNLSATALLSLIGAFISLAILPGFALLLYQSTLFLSKRPGDILIVLLASGLQTAQLQFSCIPEFSAILRVHPLFALINWLAVLLFLMILQTMLNDWGRTLLVTAITTGLWSVINHFVVLFHGSPLFFSEFRSISAAVDVLPSYRFSWDRPVLVLFLLFLSQLLFARIEAGQGKTTGVKRFARAVFCAGLLSLILCVFLNPDIKPRTTMTGSWTYGVKDYGYMSCLFEDVERRRNPVSMPDGYSLQVLTEHAQNTSSEEKPTVFPDIVMILNESFYDLRKYLELSTDTDYLEDFYNIPDAFYGYVIQPGLGGGTNNTEFELLTSNSMTLLPMSAPFTYLDFTSDVNSAAAFLKSYGYSTVAMHCGGKTNYARNRVYPVIGFDDVFLGEDQFTKGKYGNRNWTDADNYRDLIDYYNSMSESPRFLYLLTIQNHGGWEQNDSDYDTVHSLTDYGERTDDINEYLTSIQLSSLALHKLIDYFSTVNRPVVVFMMGDHAPSFLPELPHIPWLQKEEASFAAQSVPFVFWSNLETLVLPNERTITATDVFPIIKQALGFPLSPYDEAILSLADMAPARLPSGKYLDKYGALGMYDSASSSAIDTAIKLYYYMEYNLLAGGNNTLYDLFM